MATNFPTSLDSLTNPSSGDSLASPSHAAQHANVNDAVEALEAKVGVDGSAVTTSLDYKVAQQGLTFIKSQTIGSGVSSVTVTNAFSSTFENYRVLVTNYTGSSVPQWIEFQWDGVTTSYYGATHKVDRFGTASNVGRNNQPSLLVGETQGGAGQASISIEIYSPADGNYASISSIAAGSLSLITAAGSRSFSTTATGFLLKPSGGTLTGGTIRVYGYNNG